MNKLSGTVHSLESAGDICLVEVDVLGDLITSLVLEPAGADGYLAVGKPVSVLFKESEVSIATAPVAGISIRNRLACTIVSIAEGGILSHLGLEYKGQVLHSLITTRALRQLRLQNGQKVEALIKSTEVSLQEGHARI
jgi:molybdate transport system regulatory protein